jgi:tetratricopeptide (TPR) repeat protein
MRATNAKMTGFEAFDVRGIRLSRLKGSGRAVNGVERFADTARMASLAESRESLAERLVAAGLSHFERGETDAELASYREVVERFGAEPDPCLQWHVGWALYNAGRTYEDLGRLDEAVGAYDYLLSSVWPAHRARGFFGRHRVFRDECRYDEALGAIEGALHEADEDLAVPCLLAKAHILGLLGEHKAAVAVCDGVLRRGPSAIAELHRANALRRLGRLRDAVVGYEAAGCAEADLCRSVLLGELNDASGAAAAFEDFLARCVSEDGRRERFEAELLARGGGGACDDFERYLEGTRRWRDALAAYEDVLAALEIDDSSTLAEAVAHARNRVAWLENRL